MNKGRGGEYVKLQYLNFGSQSFKLFCDPFEKAQTTEGDNSQLECEFSLHMGRVKCGQFCTWYSTIWLQLRILNAFVLGRNELMH